MPKIKMFTWFKIVESKWLGQTKPNQTNNKQTKNHINRMLCQCYAKPQFIERVPQEGPLGRFRCFLLPLSSSSSSFSLSLSVFLSPLPPSCLPLLTIIKAARNTSVCNHRQILFQEKHLEAELLHQKSDSEGKRAVATNGGTAIRDLNQTLDFSDNKPLPQGFTAYQWQSRSRNIEQCQAVF